MISEIIFEVESSEKDKVYNVHIMSNSCAQQPNCVPHCQDPTCLYLCRHMMKCTCIDYTQGHLCKHVHKVQYTYACIYVCTHNILQVKTLLEHSSTAMDDDMDCNQENSCPPYLDQVDSTVEETIDQPVKRLSSGKQQYCIHVCPMCCCGNDT